MLVPVCFVGRLKALGKRSVEHFANTKFKTGLGKATLNVVPPTWAEMITSLAAAAFLALSIMVLSFALTLLAKIFKPVSDQCESLLGFKTLVVRFLKPWRHSHWVTNLEVDDKSVY